jgi:SCAMP family
MVAIIGLPVRLFSPSYTFHGHAHLVLVFPLVYHDISDEIPEASRPLITRLYILWLVLAGTLIVNMVACIFVLTSGGPDGVKDLIVSIMSVPAFYWDLLVNSPSFDSFFFWTALSL